MKGQKKKRFSDFFRSKLTLLHFWHLGGASSSEFFLRKNYRQRKNIIFFGPSCRAGFKLTPKKKKIINTLRIGSWKCWPRSKKPMFKKRTLYCHAPAIVWQRRYADSRSRHFIVISFHNLFSCLNVPNLSLFQTQFEFLKYLHPSSHNVGFTGGMYTRN